MSCATASGCRVGPPSLAASGWVQTLGQPHSGGRPKGSPLKALMPAQAWSVYAGSCHAVKQRVTPYRLASQRLPPRFGAGMHILRSLPLPVFQSAVPSLAGLASPHPAGVQTVGSKKTLPTARPPSQNPDSGNGRDEKHCYDVAVGCSLTALGKMA